MKGSVRSLSTLLLSLSISQAAIAQTASWTPFGSGCAGAEGVPVLESANFILPYVGTSFTAEVSNAPFSTVGVGITGLSDQFWGSLPLPADLGIVAMPGCLLFTEIRFSNAFMIEAGRGLWSVDIPDRPELNGLNFFQQAFVVDPSVPGLGAVMSNAGQGVAENFSGNLTVRILGGAMGTSPQAGVRVLRHDLGTGAVLDDRLTAGNGIVDFGTIRTARTTISIVIPPAAPGKDGILSTIMDVAVGNLTVLDGPEPAKLANFDVDLTSVPMGSDEAFVLLGAPDGGDEEEPDFVTPPTVSITNIEIPYLQPDGKFSIFAQAGIDGDGLSTGGMLLDLDPASITPGSTLTIPTNTAASSVPYTANVPVFTDGTLIRRKGLIFEGGVFTDPASSGNFLYSPIPGADRYGFFFGSIGTGFAFTGLFSNTVPASFNVTIPDLGMSGLNQDAGGRRFSWTLSGTDVGDLDMTDVSIEWQEQVNFSQLEWNLALPPDATSVTLPQLPMDLSLFEPPDGVFFSVEALDIDIASGYQDLLSQISAAGGTLEAVALSGSVFRAVGQDRF